VPAIRVPAGVEIVAVADRPGSWREAYDRVAGQAFEDMALVVPMQASWDDWNRDWISDPAATFVAVADGEVIGCAGVMPDTDQPTRAETGLTAVRREWRGRGVASALKRTSMRWAAENGLTEVYTWTQHGNEDMRRLNEHLGFTTRAVSITVRRALPITW
jgi:GNAT superfamily N-acetyltransferase